MIVLERHESVLWKRLHRLIGVGWPGPLSSPCTKIDMKLLIILP